MRRALKRRSELSLVRLVSFRFQVATYDPATGTYALGQSVATVLRP